MSLCLWSVIQRILAAWKLPLFLGQTDIYPSLKEELLTQPKFNRIYMNCLQKRHNLRDTSDELDFRMYLLNQSSEPDSDVDSPSACGNCMKEADGLRRCTGCEFVRYCSKNCQVKDWPSHKQFCQSIQTLPSLRDFSDCT